MRHVHTYSCTRTHINTAPSFQAASHRHIVAIPAIFGGVQVPQGLAHASGGPLSFVVEALFVGMSVYEYANAS
jgi:hypothetical protein